MRLWRLTKTKYSATAFDGEGARLYGARWNSRGTRVAYASDNSALAVLEVLVHLEDVAILPSYTLIRATIPDSLVEDIDSSSLPPDWNTFPVPPAAQAIGDNWVDSGGSLALRVPSAVVPGSNNVLINPQHREFAQFLIESLEAYAIDPRLYGSSAV